ncbi:hypothetical protein AB6A40_005049 [Gnathostoma spinigerum]|uniref:GDP/GTP exchange factor Sec2 N-terminal domain-containing protein n=1 Tax=Gnathostoma spinigerum TaxID=75299 RepID=A0ABD6EFG1_9BILA
MQTSVSFDAIASRVTDATCDSIDFSFNKSESSINGDTLSSEGGESTIRIYQLERELLAARTSIAEKEARCNQLSNLQEKVDSEVQELTEKLFQEAYRMVNEAEGRRVKSEKLLAESRLKVDMLMAEVEALKIIVKSPDSHFPIISPSKRSLAARLLSPSRKEKIVRTAPTLVPSCRKSLSLPPTIRDGVFDPADEEKQDRVFEVDPIYHREFIEWRELGAPVDSDSKFLQRILSEEIRACLTFDNSELSNEILKAIRANALELEPVPNEEKPVVRSCALTKVSRFCPYRLRFSGQSEWIFISLLARNRVAAVCDFFTYIRYVNQGIVRSGVNDSYWDIINLRKNMNLARLGLGFVPKTGGTRAENRQWP